MPGLVREALSLRIDPQSGVGLRISAGDILRVTDIEGSQVSDIVAFNAADPAEWLSGGCTLDYNSTMRLTTGHILYSNRSHPMFTIGEDTVGVHDLTLAPCSQEMFELLHGHRGYHPSCFDNLCKALAQFGIVSDSIPTAFNAFMHVEISHDGRIAVLPPLSKPGDFIEFRAEMDLLVGVTACSAEQSNAGTFGPIEICLRASPPRDCQSR